MMTNLGFLLVRSIRLLSERTDSAGESGAHGTSNSSPNMKSSKEKVMLHCCPPQILEPDLSGFHDRVSISKCPGIF